MNRRETVLGVLQISWSQFGLTVERTFDPPLLLNNRAVCDTFKTEKSAEYARFHLTWRGDWLRCKYGDKKNMAQRRASRFLCDGRRLSDRSSKSIAYQFLARHADEWRGSRRRRFHQPRDMSRRWGSKRPSSQARRRFRMLPRMPGEFARRLVAFHRDRRCRCERIGADLARRRFCSLY